MEQRQKLCIVDDDRNILESLANFFLRHGFSVECATSSPDLLKILQQSPPDCIVLDIRMPGEDGFSICRKIRSQWKVPIIFLSALGEAADRIAGLELGADDYVTKPFDPKELLVRIQNILRRTQHEPSTPGEKGSLCFAGWRLDKTSRNLTSPNGVMVSLSGAEYRLLMVFLTNPHTVLNRNTLLELTQKHSPNAIDRSVNTLVSRLRRRLRDENNTATQLIKTVHGDGYYWTASVRQEGV